MNLNQFIKETKKLKIKDYEPVLKMMKTPWGKGSKESDYHTVRKSWPYIVVGSIYFKEGTPKDNKKRTLTNIIRNWVKTESYRLGWLIFHPRKNKDKKAKVKWFFKYVDEDFNKIPQSRHIKNAADIWFSKKGKTLRQELKTHGKIKCPIDEIDIRTSSFKDSQDS